MPSGCSTARAAGGALASSTPTSIAYIKGLSSEPCSETSRRDRRTSGGGASGRGRGAGGGQRGPARGRPFRGWGGGPENRAGAAFWGGGGSARRGDVRGRTWSASRYEKRVDGA